jgi:ferritin-like metal-binding protein YciE
MPIRSLKDLYIDELGDLYDAETQMIRALPRLAEAARAPELRAALKKHCEESRLHLERLELIFTHWGERQRSRPCAGLAGIVQEADDRMNQEATDDARDAAIIGVAQRIEHYEIAAYGCARTYARRLNRSDEARLLQETLDEEGRADRKLTEIAQAHVNDDARIEGDFAAPRTNGGLRYLEASEAAQGPGIWERLPVRNDADEELGAFDGLVVDSDSRHPRYVVVDSGTLFVHRRYLLPFDGIRFDERARLLRVNLDKDVASRYPSFDREAFKVMTDAERRDYEQGLFDFFPRDIETPGVAPRALDVPEWLIRGSWVTVPAEQVDRLNDTTRAFANEFVPNREQMVAKDPGQPRSVAADKGPTPPHGDKLR